jgi:hypothetical protein
MLQESYTYLGCFKDTRTRSLPNWRMPNKEDVQVAYTHHDDFVSGGVPEIEELDDKGFHIIPSELGDMGRSGNMSKGQRIAMLVRVQSFRCAESRCCRSHIHILVASKILEPGPCRIGGCRTKRMYRSARIRRLTNIGIVEEALGTAGFFGDALQTLMELANHGGCLRCGLHHVLQWWEQGVGACLA